MAKKSKDTTEQPVVQEIRGSKDQSIKLSQNVQKAIQDHIKAIRTIMTNENLDAIMLSDAETLKNP